MRGRETSYHRLTHGNSSALFSKRDERMIEADQIVEALPFDCFPNSRADLAGKTKIVKGDDPAALHEGKIEFNVTADGGEVMAAVDKEQVDRFILQGKQPNRLLRIGLNRLDGVLQAEVPDILVEYFALRQTSRDFLQSFIIKGIVAGCGRK